MSLNLHLPPGIPAGQRGRRQPGPSASGTSRWRTALLELRRGLPFTTPTRLELINTRLRFTLPMVTASSINPCVLFHPCRSISHLLAFNHEVTQVASGFNFEGFLRSGADNAATYDWIGDTYLGINNTTFSMHSPTQGGAEAIGVPSTLVSPLTRVTGGVLSLRITCGPGTTGYIAFSSPSVGELTPLDGFRNIYTAHATNPRIRRLELGQGTHNHHFTVPLASPGALETFFEANDRFQWGVDDPFGGTVITFHDINYNIHQGVSPVVELYSTVGIQCRLEIADRHLSTAHRTSTKESKTTLANAGGGPFAGSSKNGMDQHVQDASGVG